MAKWKLYSEKKIHREKSKIQYPIFDATLGPQTTKVGWFCHWPQERTRWLRNQCCGSGFGAGDFLTPRFGMEKSRAKIRGPGSGMNIPDLIFVKLVISFLGYKILYHCWSDPGSEMEKSDPGSWIQDPGSAPGTQYIATIHWRFSQTFWTNNPTQYFINTHHSSLSPQIILNYLFRWIFYVAHI